MKNIYRRAQVYFNTEQAGILEEIESGYRFTYSSDFIKKDIPISVSLPLRNEPYESKELFPFFEGVLPEGAYLEIVTSKFKVDKKDLFGIALKACAETIGAVSIKEIQSNYKYSE